MSVEGKWSITMNTPIGRQDFVWDIRQAAGGWTGSMIAKSGTSELTDVKVAGDTVSFATTVKSPMGTIHVTFSGAVAEDTVSGICKTTFGDNAFSGVRA